MVGPEGVGGRVHVCGDARKSKIRVPDLETRRLGRGNIPWARPALPSAGRVVQASVLRAVDAGGRRPTSLSSPSGLGLEALTLKSLK
jgi:hypothetical protein